ncbi:MAG: hypothetical protein J7549_12120 [Variovorax sp.]|nr:hypothetical protein [Variovorax sp.]
MKKTRWCAVAGVGLVLACLAGCSGSDDAQAAALAPVTAQKNIVRVTWRPVDKTDEFLSAWRAKE